MNAGKYLAWTDRDAIGEPCDPGEDLHTLALSGQGCNPPIIPHDKGWCLVRQVHRTHCTVCYIRASLATTVFRRCYNISRNLPTLCLHRFRRVVPCSLSSNNAMVVGAIPSGPDTYFCCSRRAHLALVLKPTVLSI